MKKSKSQQILEYVGLMTGVAIVKALPYPGVRALCRILGDLLFAFLPERRMIAENNLKIAFGGELSDAEIKRLARRSCHSFFMMAADAMRSPLMFNGKNALRDQRYRNPHLEELLKKAKRIHDESRGCIFVTPHIGRWEILPYISAMIGIPLAIVMRPMDNPYIERALLSNRVASGQVVVPKKNALFVLERMLRQGKSLGILPDQRTGRGLRVKFFGREAYVTPVPAVLAVTYKRPVVVVAACRTDDPDRSEGFVSDPIVPGKNPRGEQAEIMRITAEINMKMEEIIRKYPEQYLWMHDRWKDTQKKPIFSGI